MKVRCAYNKLVPIAELRSHPKNRNKHPDTQIARLAQILEYQGFRYPVKVSNLSGYVTSGHGRIEAAKKNGWTEVPVNYQDYESEEQEYADVQADNAIASWAELDLSGINSDLGDLGPDFDIDLLGIKDFELEVADKLAPGDEDEVGEPPSEPKTKPGDLYVLGRHRLLCGDSTSIDAVERLMNGERADMVFTDPPYGMNAVSKDGKVGGGTAHAPARTYRPVLGDEDTTVARDCYSLVASLGIPQLIIWGGNYFTDFLPPSPCWLVWDKQRPEGLTFADGEVAWTNFTTPLKFIRHRWDGYHRASERDQTRVHPTQKPAFLAEWCFKEYGDENDAVLDLFGGSGSTLIACEKTNRRCFMMELDPHYVDVIVSRYLKYTGQTSVIRNGEEIEWGADGEE